MSVGHKMLDLGEVYRTAESVKASRARRNAIESVNRRQNAVEKERAAYMGGDGKAMGRMIIADPQSAAQFQGALAKMGEPERKAAAERAETIGRAAAMILSAPAADRPRIYAEIRNTLPDEWKGKLPEQYVEGVVMQVAAGAKETMDIIEGQAKHRNNLALEDKKSGNKLAEEQRNAARADKIRAENRKNELSDADADRAFKLKLKREKEGAKGGNAIKTADSNAIGRAVGDAFGGNFDPVSGTFSGMDKEQARRALGVRARAERIYLDSLTTSRPMTQGEATRQALDEAAGLSDKTGTPAARNDPLGIRD